MHRTTRSIAVLVAAVALLSTAVPTLAMEMPPNYTFDGVVTVVFHDPEYDNGNGIEGADVTLTVVNLLLPDLTLQEQQGTTDAAGAAVFTEVARPLEGSWVPAFLELRVTAVRDRTSVDPDGCTVGELLAGEAIVPAGLEVTINVAVLTQQDGRTCPPPTPDPPIIVEGNAVDPDGEPLAIVHAEAVLEFDDLLPIETGADGSFRVEVPAASAGVERLLEVTLIGPDVRTVEDEEGCLITWTLVARGSWTLIGDQAPAPSTLVAAEEPLSGVCGGATATPAPAAPVVTLPPTDTSDRGLADIGGGLAAGLILLLAISLAATIAAERRVSREGN